LSGAQKLRPACKGQDNAAQVRAIEAGAVVLELTKAFGRLILGEKAAESNGL